MQLESARALLFVALAGEIRWQRRLKLGRARPATGAGAIWRLRRVFWENRLKTGDGSSKKSWLNHGRLGKEGEEREGTGKHGSRKRLNTIDWRGL